MTPACPPPAAGDLPRMERAVLASVLESNGADLPPTLARLLGSVAAVGLVLRKVDR